MVAPRALTLTFAIVIAACTNPSTLAPPSPSGAAVEPTTTALALPSITPVPLPRTTPAIDLGLAGALEIAPPYKLDPPSATDFDRLSGNIQGLPSDLARGAGADYMSSDFPMGFRFVREGEELVGVIAIVAMPAEVAEQSGLLESIAPGVAVEVNATLVYETIHGVKAGVVRGPIASTVAIFHGHFVMAQSGQPAVHPRDLMAAVVAANGEGFADASTSTE